MNIEELKKLAKLINSTKDQHIKNEAFEILENYFNTTFKQPAQSYDEYGTTLLHWAVLCNRYDKVVDLVESQGADINAVVKPYDRYCKSNYTPIYIATVCQYENIIKFLLDKKADLSIKPTSSYYYDGLMNGEYTDELEPVTSIARRSKNPNIVKLFELPTLNDYIDKRAKDKREYKLTLFCNMFNCGGSKSEKLAAAGKFKDLIENGHDDVDHLSKLKNTDPRINQGELGKIYRTSINLRK